VARAALDRRGAQVAGADRCRALAMAGWMGIYVGQETEPQQCLAEALQIARGLGDARLLCHVLVKASHIRLERGETELSVPLATEALALGRQLGDCVEFSEALMQRSQGHLRARQYDEARALITEALAVRRRIGNATGAVSSCSSLAELELDTGRLHAARERIEETLGLMTEVDSQIAGLHCIALVAQWAAAIGHPETAVLLDAAHERESRRAGLTDRFGVFQTERLLRTRAALDDASRDRFAAAGAGLGFEGALRTARAFVAGTRAPAQHDS